VSAGHGEQGREPLSRRSGHERLQGRLAARPRSLEDVAKLSQSRLSEDGEVPTEVGVRERSRRTVEGLVFEVRCSGRAQGEEKGPLGEFSEDPFPGARTAPPAPLTLDHGRERMQAASLSWLACTGHRIEIGLILRAPRRLED
jgi:hypothetical protein